MFTGLNKYLSVPSETQGKNISFYGKRISFHGKNISFRGVLALEQPG